MRDNDARNRQALNIAIVVGRSLQLLRELGAGSHWKYAKDDPAFGDKATSC